MSDAKLRTKVALQQAGVIGAPLPAPAPALPAKAEEKANGHAEKTSNGAPARASAPPTAQASQEAANLARDVRAARNAPTAVVDSSETPTARVLQEPETRVSNEGENLLKGTRAE